LVHKNVKCFIYWREKPKGTGESSVIIIPCDGRARESIENHHEKLLKIFDSTTNSEETVDFRIQELDR